MEYRSDIERLRAVAVLSVLVYHFFPNILPGGFIGVDIFFVISGFLISGLLLASLKSGRFSLLEFYRRRIRRILPALIPVLSFLLIAGAFLLFADEYQQLGRHTVSSVLFLQNFLLYQESGYFDQAAEKKPLLHLWSLSVEEQFYFLWPLLLAFGFRRGWRMPWLIGTLLAVSMLFNLAIRHTNPSGDFFWSFPRFWELLVGALAATVPQTALHRLKPWRRSLRGLGAILISAALLGLRPGMAYPGFWAVLPTLGAGLLILNRDLSGEKVFSAGARLTESIGRISYPLYLWHWPLLSLGQIITGGALPTKIRILLLTLTFFFAAMSHHALEIPFRRDPTWRGPILLIGMMLSLLAIGATLVANEGFPNRPIEQRNPGHMEKPIRGYESTAPDCGLLGASERLKSHCKVFDIETHQKSFLVWGDSSAIAWTPVLMELARRWQARLIVVGHTSCPPLLAARKTHFDLPASAHYCQDGQIQSDVINLAQSTRPDLIFFMGALGGYRTEADVAREDTEFMADRPHVEADRITNRETLLARVPETLEQLSLIAPVMAFKTWPLLPASLPEARSRRFLDQITRNLEARSYDRHYFDAQRALVDSLLEAAESNRVSLFDPSSPICNDHTCVNQIDGIPAYQDRYHITPKASMTYLEALDQRIHHILGP